MPWLNVLNFVAITWLTTIIAVLVIAAINVCRNFRYKTTQLESRSDDQSIKSFKQFCQTKFRGNCCLEMSLTPYTRFRVGGNAELFFRPSSIMELVSVLKRKPKQFVVTPLGYGSNMLVRDGGLYGIVIQIAGRGFSQFSIIDVMTDKHLKIIEVGAGMSQQKFAKICAKAGISGLEFFCGIPGTIGGALRMNAGANGSQVSDRLISAIVVNPQGEIQELSMSELKYEYRCCGLPKDWIFISAKFRGYYLLRSREEIELSIQEMLKLREETQPVNEKTAGCTFTNPEGRLAWKLINDAGCQGEIIGGAQISKKHSNFLLNFNSATAEELESLGELVQRRVYEHSGILLKWEVERLGIRKTQAK